MIFAVRFFLIISLYSLAALIFWFYIYLHANTQIFTCYVCDGYQELNVRYDFIVVGSGTAGAIVAHRLAQDKKCSVLLLEAGPYSNFLFDIPVLGPLLQQSSIDWQYETVPQKDACLGLEKNVSRWPMGRLFGGTGRLNNMIHVRGHKQDYDEWYKHETSYNYKTDILDYFERLESRRISYKNKLYSSSGPVAISSPRFVSPLAESILQAAEYLSHSSETTNFDNHLDFQEPLVNLRNGKRCTPADNLLSTKPDNLHILTNALVTKVLFNNFEAYGVQYTHLQAKKTIKARKGIVLSAGVIGSPKLLMLSGIGPQKHLNKLKIPVHQNLPVGQNLQDHVTTGLDLIILNETLPVNVEKMMSFLAPFSYFILGEGPWTTVGCEALGFCHTNATSRDTKPNLGFMVLPVGVTQDGGVHLKNAVSIAQHVWDKYFGKLIGKQVISILPIVLHPKSVGTVKLRNSNSDAAPIINPRYLSKPEDVAVLIEGIKLIQKLIETPPMQKLGAKLNRQKFPGCEHLKFDTNSYWECYVRQLTLTAFHPVGTCKMGHSRDKTSVVDYSFMVKGTNKLFVADASVMPSLISGNINAAVALLAEKAADSIKYYNYLTSGTSQKIEVFVTKDICIKF